MKKNRLLKTSLSVAILLTASTVSASDQALLDTLFENGVLNKLQYETLSKQAEEKQRVQAAKISSISPKIAKALDWASKVSISGDMRFRHENADIDGGSKDGVKESRQRIRARLKIAAKINDEVDAGFRIATGLKATSGNHNLEDSFRGKDIYFDRAYINWHPDFIKGLNASFGKFKQPWYNVSTAGLIWDSDVNPEGVALKYKTKAGPVNLAITAGYFILEDGDTVTGSSSDNNSFSDDLNMYHAGISGSMQFNDAVKGTVGSNTYIYNNESTVGEFKDSTPLEIYEVASRFDFNTALLPVYLYSQYAVNASAEQHKDTAWLAGFGAKYGPFNMDYNYRDTQENAVADSFNDGAFASGSTAARGHKVKLAYKISNNFAAAFAYFAAKKYDNTKIDVLHIDLKAKF